MPIKIHTPEFVSPKCHLQGRFFGGTTPTRDWEQRFGLEKNNQGVPHPHFCPQEMSVTQGQPGKLKKKKKQILWEFCESHPQVPSSWEIFSIFVEGHGHDPVCGVKSFLHPIPVVDVDVNVQHSLVVPGKNHKIAFIVRKNCSRAEGKERRARNSGQEFQGKELQGRKRN